MWCQSLQFSESWAKAAVEHFHMETEFLPGHGIVLLCRRLANIWPRDAECCVSA